MSQGDDPPIAEPVTPIATSSATPSAARSESVSADAPPIPPMIRTLGLIAGRPLVGVAIALMVGIAIHGWLPLQAPLWLGLGGIAIAGAWALAHRVVAATALIFLATAALGTALAQLQSGHYPADHIAHFTTASRRLAQVEFRFVDPPRIFAPTFGQAFPLPPRQTAFAEVTAVRTWDGWKPSQGRVLVQIAEPNPLLKVGQRIRAFGMIDRPAAAENPGQFDWATYYRQQRVLAAVHIPHAGNMVIVDEGSPGLLQRWRAYTRDKLADGFTDSQSLDHALLRALVLGDSDPELREVQEQFRKTGTSHHLAISGMHIAIMGGVVFLVARLFRLPPRWGWGAAMVFVFVYGLAALPSPPVMRSILLWLAIGAAILSRRGVDFLHMLALVVIAMLVWQPLDLFNAGFQLSFGTVLGLILLTRPFTRWGKGAAEELPESHAGQTRWFLRMAAYIDNQFLLALCAAIAAWLVSMPIVAAHFTQLNPWAVLASIGLSPVVFLALIGGVLKVLLTAIWPGMAESWALLAQFPVVWMRKGVEWLGALPFGDVPMPAPSWWLIVAFYVLLLSAVAAWPWKSVRVLSRIGGGVLLLLMLFLPFASVVRPASGGSMRVMLLSVGAGQCALVEPPSGRATLLDAGSLSLADPVRQAIAPFLRERGITRLDTIAISHANSDHFSAVGELVEAYGVRDVLTGPGFLRSMAGNAAGNEMMAALRRSQRPPTTVMPGHVVPLANDTSLKVLWPPDEPGMASNDQSMVLMLTHADTRILFTGDIQEAAMKRLLETPEAIRAEILVAPHHGSSEAITPAFLRAVSPRAIVASNDRTLSGKQLRFNAMVGDIPLYRTHSSGAITILVDENGAFRIETYLESPKQ